MDEVGTMTVPPPLPAKTQARGASQGARQTVSIRAISSPPASSSLTTVAGATVFVGVSAPAAADSTATCRRRIPEVQTTNGYSRQSTVQTSQQQVHQQQQQQEHLNHSQYQQQQQAAHVVKIKINPDGDKNGRVISTVRLTLDGNVGHEIENGIVACERSARRNNEGAVVISATNHVNDKYRASGAGGAGEACVKISVNNNNNNVNRNNNNNDCNNLRNNNNHEITKDRVISIGVVSRDADMVHHGPSETMASSAVSNQSSGCFHYGSFQSPLVMSSGQYSPSDTLDSGTCSDLDGTPPPLPKKKNASSTVIVSGCGQHNRTGSMTSSGAEVDSDDNESNISCDSLNGAGELETGRIVKRNGSANEENAEEIAGYEINSTRRSNDLGPKDVGKDESAAVEQEQEDEDDTELRGVRLTNGTLLKKERTEKEVPRENDATSSEGDACPSPALVHSPTVSLSPSGSSSSLSKASSTPRVRSPDPLALQNGSRLSSPMVDECTYEERKQEQQERIEQESGIGGGETCGGGTDGRRYVYEYDRFYKFHVNELGKGDKEESSREPGDNENDESFAGYKILDREAIRSAKGTVRGVKNRVRAGIATFLEKPASKAYKAIEKDKVVVYTTTSGIVRETFHNCMKVKQILRTHLVKYDERDLFCSTELQSELKDRLDCSNIELPQLFIDGQYIGDVDAVERLNESGELRRILKPYKRDDVPAPCLFCGDRQLLLCPDCNGSKRSVYRNAFTVEFASLKCVKCNEFGFVYCLHC